MVSILLRKPLQGTAVRLRMAIMMQKADWSPLQQAVPTVLPSRYLSLILIPRTLVQECDEFYKTAYHSAMCVAELGLQISPLCTRNNDNFCGPSR